MIGTLQTDQPGKVYLLNTEVLDKANYSTITKLFDKSMFLLWVDGICHDGVFLFLSDTAPYMIDNNLLSCTYSPLQLVLQIPSVVLLFMKSI